MSIEIESLQADVQALKSLTINLIGLVRELYTDHDSWAHTDYCMDPDCFRCDVAHGRYELD